MYLKSFPPVCTESLSPIVSLKEGATGLQTKKVMIFVEDHMSMHIIGIVDCNAMYLVT